MTFIFIHVFTIIFHLFRSCFFHRWPFRQLSIPFQVSESLWDFALAFHHFCLDFQLCLGLFVSLRGVLSLVHLLGSHGMVLLLCRLAQLLLVVAIQYWQRRQLLKIFIFLLSLHLSQDQLRVAMISIDLHYFLYLEPDLLQDERSSSHCISFCRWLHGHAISLWTS